VTQTADKPIGVVIPAHGHPAFLAEAIVSACEQECSQPVKVVVVDDGCRFPETGQVAAVLQAEYPGKLFYFRHENTRLPGARNAGIQFLLNLEPDMDAIFFLDADNRLESYALESYRRSLGDDPAIGWAYPDIAFFGLSWADDGFEIRETSVEYSELKHLTGNISEAGSLVRADVFRGGVFFDESMRSGLEDWDFWLSVLEAGYKGVRAEQSGFLYRRRPESMLSASQREVESLLQRIRKKHPSLFSPAHLLQLEQKENPVFAIHIAGEDTVRLTSDPLLEGETVSLLVFKELLQARLRGELEYFFPEYLLILSPSEAKRWEILNKHLRWCFWVMKETLSTISQVNLSVDHRAGHDFELLTAQSTPKALLVSQQELKVLVRQLMPFDASACKPESVLKLNVPYVDFGKEKLGDPSCSANDDANVQDTLAHLVAQFHEKKQWAQHQNRQYSGPAAINTRLKLVDDICAETGHRPYPICDIKLRDVFVFNASYFNSRSFYKLTKFIQERKNMGHEIACFMEHGTRVVADQYLPVEWDNLISDIVYYFIPDSIGETRHYLGHRISNRMTLPQIEAASVLLRRANNVFLVDDVASVEVAGAVRQHGTQVTVINTKGATYLTPVMAKYLAYEHVLDHIIVDGMNTKSLLAAAGFPLGKISI